MSSTSTTPSSAPDPVPGDVRDLDADEVVRQLVVERHVAARAQARELALAVHFVDLHPVTDEQPAATPDGQRLVVEHPPHPEALAGQGTPAVAAFAVEELGAALHISYAAALSLVTDAVERCFRLPKLWALTQAGVLPAWQGRRAAQHTSALSQDAAAFVDGQVALLAAGRRFPAPDRLRSLVHEAHCRTDPDWQEAVEERASANHRVDFAHATCPATGELATAGTSSMTATMDTWDALQLETAVADLAATLGALGDDDSLDTRRARALGLLADPQHVLHLTQPAHEERQTDSNKPRRAGRGSTLHLYVHASLADLARAGLGQAQTDLTCALATKDRAGVTGYGLVERFGPALLVVLESWLQRADRVVIRPVLDPSNPDTTATRAVDRHDPPAAMRELVMLRDGHCVFPGCTVDARSCDQDHLREYVPPDDGGPPGQTHPHNLAYLCRRHHRLKTFTAWTYQRLLDGSYEWTSPRGRALLSHPTPRRGPSPRCDLV